MATAQDVADEISGTAPGDDHHAAPMYEDGPSFLLHIARSIQDKVTHAAREITKFLPGRSLDHEAVQAFLADPTRKDTNLGHTLNGAALARATFLVVREMSQNPGVKVDLAKLDL